MINKNSLTGNEKPGSRVGVGFTDVAGFFVELSGVHVVERGER